MDKPNIKLILIVCLSLLVLIGAVTIRKTTFNFVFRIEDEAIQGLLSAEVISVEGSVVRFPFRQYSSKGLVHIGSHIYRIESIKHHTSLPDGLQVYSIKFRGANEDAQDRVMSIGDIVLFGNMAENVVKESVGYITMNFEPWETKAFKLTPVP